MLFVYSYLTAVTIACVALFAWMVNGTRAEWARLDNSKQPSRHIGTTAMPPQWQKAA